MGLNTDEIIFIGSPGVGVDHASDLGIPPENVHASTAENDIIQVTNTPDEHQRIVGPLSPDPPPPVKIPDPLGDDPTDKDFGASTFESEPGANTWGIPHVPSVDAHTSYYERGSKSVENMGRIVTEKGAN